MTKYYTSFILPFFMLFTAFGRPGTPTKPEGYRVYFGTTARHEQQGIYMSMLDVKTGTLSDAIHVSKAKGPSFIAVHPDGKHLYATGSGTTTNRGNQGSVSAFSINEPGGLLNTINSQPSGGKGPCHVSLGPDGKNLLVANYGGGSCSVLPIHSNGSLAPPTSTQLHTGSSVDPKRQSKAFVHSINIDPSGQFAMVADLGIDKIMIYQFDGTAGILTSNNPSFITIEAGGGPRHFTFHPAGKFAYANLELSNKAVAYTYDPEQGELNEIQSISTLPDTDNTPNTTSEIITSPDGRFLYVGNRGHNSIALFSIHSKTGELTAIGHEPTRGETPRNFNIDPTGTYLLVANQKSSTIMVFKINRETGKLTFTGRSIDVPNPSCIRFIATR